MPQLCRKDIIIHIRQHLEMYLTFANWMWALNCPGVLITKGVLTGRRALNMNHLSVHLPILNLSFPNPYCGMHDD